MNEFYGQFPKSVTKVNKNWYVFQIELPLKFTIQACLCIEFPYLVSLQLRICCRAKNSAVILSRRNFISFPNRAGLSQLYTALTLNLCSFYSLGHMPWHHDFMQISSYLGASDASDSDPQLSWAIRIVSINLSQPAPSQENSFLPIIFANIVHLVLKMRSWRLIDKRWALRAVIAKLASLIPTQENSNTARLPARFLLLLFSSSTTKWGPKTAWKVVRIKSGNRNFV